MIIKNYDNFYNVNNNKEEIVQEILNFINEIKDIWEKNNMQQKKESWDCIENLLNFLYKKGFIDKQKEFEFDDCLCGFLSQLSIEDLKKRTINQLFFLKENVKKIYQKLKKQDEYEEADDVKELDTKEREVFR